MFPILNIFCRELFGKYVPATYTYCPSFVSSGYVIGHRHNEIQQGGRHSLRFSVEHTHECMQVCMQSRMGLSGEDDRSSLWCNGISGHINSHISKTEVFPGISKRPQCGTHVWQTRSGACGQTQTSSPCSKYHTLQLNMNFCRQWVLITMCIYFNSNFFLLFKKNAFSKQRFAQKVSLSC